MIEKHRNITAEIGSTEDKYSENIIFEIYCEARIPELAYELNGIEYRIAYECSGGAIGLSLDGWGPDYEQNHNEEDINDEYCEEIMFEVESDDYYYFDEDLEFEEYREYLRELEHTNTELSS